MKSALVVDSTAAGIHDLAADLTAAGIHVVGAGPRSSLVRDAIRLAPDWIVCHTASVDGALLDACALLASTAPCAVVVFTNDPDVAKIEHAMRSGIHAYVVNGYGVNRLRSVLHVAQARFHQERALRHELAQVSQRYDERKLVDRAKGILMRARELTEEDAFRMLRTASMHSKRRVGEVAQQVIATAHYADALNRAGRLRMLSQRLVKCCALQLLATPPAQTQARLTESIQAIDANIAALGKSLSKATFGDLLEAVEAAWPPLRALVETAAAGPAAPRQLLETDRLAEHLLTQADHLTRQLETAGLVTTLHVINVCGRQRMWSQRFAKEALFDRLLGPRPARPGALPERAESAFEESMSYLREVPLSTRAIRAALDGAAQEWAVLVQAGRQVASAEGRQALSESSEALLALFDQLTDQYESSMQVLMG
jgi:AmiR/NasT family two-component response regulator